MQDHTTTPQPGIGVAWYIGAVVMPLGGIIAGIYHLAKNRIGPGLALLTTATLAAAVGVALTFAGFGFWATAQTASSASKVDATSQCIMDAATLDEINAC